MAFTKRPKEAAGRDQTSTSSPGPTKPGSQIRPGEGHPARVGPPLGPPGGGRQQGLDPFEVWFRAAHAVPIARTRFRRVNPEESHPCPSSRATRMEFEGVPGQIAADMLGRSIEVMEKP